MIITDFFCGHCDCPVTKSGMSDETWFYCECCGHPLSDDEVIERVVDEIETKSDIITKVAGDRVVSTNPVVVALRESLGFPHLNKEEK